MERRPRSARRGFAQFVVILTAAALPAPAAPDGPAAKSEEIRELRRFDGHTASITSVAISPDGKLALSASQDRTVRLWDVKTGKELRRLIGHKLPVWSLAFAPDGTWAVTGSGGLDSPDNTVRIWDIPSGKERLRLVGHKQMVHCVAVSPDGRRVLSGSGGTNESEVRLWDVATGKELQRMRQNSYVQWAGFSADGREAWALSWNHVRRWHLSSGQNVDALDLGPVVAAAAFSRDGRRLLSNGMPPHVSLWDLGKKARRAEVGMARFAAPGEAIYLQSGGGEGHHYSVSAVALSADGRRGLIGVNHFYAKLTDRTSRRPVADMKLLDCTVRLWDLEAGKELQRLVGHTHFVEAVAFSPDGRFAISGSGDNTVRLWKLTP
jgi:WD40 repeat protein